MAAPTGTLNLTQSDYKFITDLLVSTTSITQQDVDKLTLIIGTIGELARIYQKVKKDNPNLISNISNHFAQLASIYRSRWVSRSQVDQLAQTVSTTKGACDVCAASAASKAMPGGDTYGSAEDEAGAEPDLTDSYQSKKRAILKEALLRAMASALKSMNFQGIDPNASLEQLSKDVIAALSSGKFKGDEKTHVAMCTSFANILNKYYANNLIDTGKGVDPAYICRQVSDVVYSLSTDTFREATVYLGAIRRVLSNLRVVRTAIDAVTEDLNHKDLSETAVTIQMYKRLGEIMQTQIEILSNLLGANVDEIELEMSQRLKNDEELNKFVSRLEARPGTKEFAKSIENVMALLSSFVFITPRAQKLLDTVGMSIDKFKSLKNFQEFNDLIFEKKILTNMQLSSGSDRLEQVGLAIEDLEKLFNNRKKLTTGSGDEIIPLDIDPSINMDQTKSWMDKVQAAEEQRSYIGARDRSSRRGKSGVYGKKEETHMSRLFKDEDARRNAIFKIFRRQLDVAYEKVISALVAIRKASRSDKIDLSSKYENYIDAVDRLQNLRFANLSDVLIGYYKGANAIQLRTDFTNCMNEVSRTAKAFDGVSEFQTLVSAISDLLDLVNKNADQVASIYGREEDYTVEGGADTHPIQRSGVDISVEARRSRDDYRMKRQLAAMHAQSLATSDLTKDYEKTLADAIAIRIQQLNALREKLFSKDPAKVEISITNALAAGLGSVIDERITVHKQFYKVLEGIDIYLKNFTIAAPQKAELLSNLSKIVSNNTIIANFYDKDEAKFMASWFEDSSAKTQIMSDPTYIEYISRGTVGTGLMSNWDCDYNGAYTGPVNLATPVYIRNDVECTVKDYRDLMDAYDKFSAHNSLIKNFFSTVFNIGGDEIASPQGISKANIYKWTMDMLKHSAVSLGIRTVGGAPKICMNITRIGYVGNAAKDADFISDDITFTLNQPASAGGSYSTPLASGLGPLTLLGGSSSVGRGWELNCSQVATWRTDISDLIGIPQHGVSALNVPGIIAPLGAAAGNPLSNQYIGGELFNFVQPLVYFNDMIKALFTKACVVLGLTNLRKQSLTYKDMATYRLILGAAETVVEVKKEAAHLYYYIPLLLEFYLSIFGVDSAFQPTPTDLAAVILPELVDNDSADDAIFSPLIRLVFVDAAKYTKDGQYSVSDTGRMIALINKVYEKCKALEGEDVTRTAINKLINVINLRYRVITKSDYVDYVKIRQMRDSKPNFAGTQSTAMQNIELFDGEIDDDQSTSLPSDAQIGVTIDEQSSLQRTRLDRIKHMKLIDDLMTRVQNFLSSVTTTGNNPDYATYRDVVDRVVGTLRAEDDGSRKFELASQLVHANIAGISLHDVQSLIFHDFVLTLVDNIDAVFKVYDYAYGRLHKIYPDYIITQTPSTAGGVILTSVANTLNHNACKGQVEIIQNGADNITINLPVTTGPGLPAVPTPVFNGDYKNIKSSPNFDAIRTLLFNATVMTKEFVDLINVLSVSSLFDVSITNNRISVNSAGFRTTLDKLLGDANNYLDIFTGISKNTNWDTPIRTDIANYASIYDNYFGMSTTVEKDFVLPLQDLFNNYIVRSNEVMHPFANLIITGPLTPAGLVYDPARNLYQHDNYVDPHIFLFSFFRHVQYRQTQTVPIKKDEAAIYLPRHGLSGDDYMRDPKSIVNRDLLSNKRGFLGVFQDLLHRLITQLYDPTKQAIYSPILADLVNQNVGLIKGGKAYPDTIFDLRKFENNIRTASTPQATFQQVSSLGLNIGGQIIESQDEELYKIIKSGLSSDHIVNAGYYGDHVDSQRIALSLYKGYEYITGLGFNQFFGGVLNDNPGLADSDNPTTVGSRRLSLAMLLILYMNGGSRSQHAGVTPEMFVDNSLAGSNWARDYKLAQLAGVGAIFGTLFDPSGAWNEKSLVYKYAIKFYEYLMPHRSKFFQEQDVLPDGNRLSSEMIKKNFAANLELFAKAFRNAFAYLISLREVGMVKISGPASAQDALRRYGEVVKQLNEIELFSYSEYDTSLARIGDVQPNAILSSSIANHLYKLYFLNARDGSSNTPRTVASFNDLSEANKEAVRGNLVYFQELFGLYRKCLMNCRNVLSSVKQVDSAVSIYNKINNVKNFRSLMSDLRKSGNSTFPPIGNIMTLENALTYSPNDLERACNAIRLSSVRSPHEYDMVQQSSLDDTKECIAYDTLYSMFITDINGDLIVYNNVKQSSLSLLDNLIDGTNTVLKGVRDVSAAIGDKPRFLYTSERFIENYRDINKAEPLGPLSSINIFTVSPNDFSIDGNRSNCPIPREMPGENQFKLLYGIRSIMSGKDISQENYPGIYDEIARYNTTVKDSAKLDQGTLLTTAKNIIDIGRSLIDLHYVGYIIEDYDMIAGIFNNGTVPRSYQGKPTTTLNEVLYLTENGKFEDSVQPIRNIVNQSRSMVSPTDRKAIISNAFASMEIMPINPIAITRDLPLSALGIYASNFTRVFDKILANSTVPAKIAQMIKDLINKPYSTDLTEGMDNLSQQLSSSPDYKLNSQIMVNIIRNNHYLFNDRLRFISDQLYHQLLCRPMSDNDLLSVRDISETRQTQLIIPAPGIAQDFFFVGNDGKLSQINPALVQNITLSQGMSDLRQISTLFRNYLFVGFAYGMLQRWIIEQNMPRIDTVVTGTDTANSNLTFSKTRNNSTYIPLD